VMINLGKAQIFERKMAQALYGVIRGELPGPYLLQKFADGLGIHFLNLQQHRRIPTIMLEMLALARFRGWVIPSKKASSAGLPVYTLNTASLALAPQWPVCRSHRLNPKRGEVTPNVPRRMT